MKFLHRAGGHVGVLVVNERTEALVQNSNAVDFSITAKQRMLKQTKNDVCRSFHVMMAWASHLTF